MFDEILVNAADNKQRGPTMDALRVEIDAEGCCVSVCNNDGVPNEIHQEEGVYVPEMIFGHLLTSSNYNDNEKKTNGGRNSYSAKLTNIISMEFVIETGDGCRQKKYKQVHIAASECLLELIKLYRDFPLTERRDAKFEGELVELCESEKSEQAKALLKQCPAVLKDLTGVTMAMD